MSSRILAAVLLGALLAGCGTLPRSASGPGGGGYYKDDGPGANPPPNLASIPDAQPKIEPLDRAANRPYQALGKEYVPLSRVRPYHERGLASWYGRRYNGLKTASGERYDMYAMTAAHPVLPIPSYARVTDLSTGRSVVVRINDRGPFWPGRVIDLSYAAAYKLGIVAHGSAMVEVDSIVPGETQLAQHPAQPQALASVASQPDRQAAATPADAPPPAAATDHAVDPRTASPAAAERAEADASESEPSGFYLQLGAFSARSSAVSFRAHLYRELGWLSNQIHVLAVNGLYKLHLGPYSTPEQARTVAARIQGELNFKPMFVVR